MMSSIILLCVLLQAFSTCSLINIKEQPQDLSHEQSVLRDLRTTFLTVSNTSQQPSLFLKKLVEVGDAMERCWSMCLDRMSAYSHNQNFFNNILPNFLNGLGKDANLHPFLLYTQSTLHVEMSVFCERASLATYWEDLAQMVSFFKDGCGPFEGLSDEFLTLAADYIRSTINARKLELVTRLPDAFKDSQYKSVDTSVLQRRLVIALVHLRGLVKGLQEVDLMNICHRLSTALKAARRTMVPANTILLDFLTDSLLKNIPLLAERVNGSISDPCHQHGLAPSATRIIADIETIMIPLYRAQFDLDRAAAEQRGRGEVCWNDFLESLFARESILAKPEIDTMRRISEKSSELIDALLDMFLRGEDELWTFGLHAKLSKVSPLWSRVLGTLAFFTDIREVLPCSKYMCYLHADFSLIVHILNAVERLEDPLAFERPTREKLAEFWREAQALLRLLRSLCTLKFLTKSLNMKNDLEAAFVKELLSSVLDEQINAVQRQGINFHLGTYHQFINELPEHQEALAQFLKTASDELSRAIADDAIGSVIETIFLPLNSPIFTPLKESLKKLFTSSPQLTQLQTLLSRSAESRNRRSKRRASKHKGKSNSCKTASPKATVSKMQVFVRAGPQYVDVDDVSRGAENSLKLFEENFENSWTLIEVSQNRQRFGRLATQSAREVLRRFAHKPRDCDRIPPVDSRDMRSNKNEVKIATLNAEWLFLFDLSTDKFAGKIKWKTLEEAWDHIKDVADAIRRINADIICLCEVQDLRILSILVELLPELNYRAYLIPNHDSLSQNVGILTRVDTHASISKIGGWFSPKNIVFHLKLDNGSGELVDLVLTGVHLISSTAEADYGERARQRRDQAKALKQHLALNHDTSGETIHLVLGDFNMVDPELLSAQAANTSEGALEVVKYDDFKLFNIMNSKTAPRDRAALANSVCHIFTTHPDRAGESQLFNFDTADAPSRLERVSDHALIVTTIRLLNHNQQMSD